ncbi:DUF7257 domain-containing protein [Rhodococcus erythropolis]|uniref:DUF7257 domain-containing protein n=1 Tax=Rhodococcus erythropolis TaxID=1833 RepID=UPI00087800CA|nr:hypothetical protein [Rhodococcus erythropolis]OFV79228.1 hypothetical protein RERY_02340 [Rhodococcus erythropolis]
MAYLIADGSSAKPLKQMPIGNGAGGTVPIQKIMAGTGTAAVELWPGKKKFSDNFERADAVFGTADGWHSTTTASPYYLWAVGGNARVFDNNTDGSRSGWSNWNEDTKTGVQYSKGTLATVGASSLGTWCMVHANQTMTDYMGLQWNGNGALALFTSVGGTIRKNTTKTQNVGDTLELRAHLNASGKYEYEAWINGLFVIDWVDETNIVNTDLNHRRVGFGMQRNRSFFNSTFSAQFSEWEGGDF